MDNKVYYKILLAKDNKTFIGIGFAKKAGIPPDCKTFLYKAITEEQYLKLEKKLYAY